MNIISIQFFSIILIICFLGTFFTYFVTYLFYYRELPYNKEGDESIELEQYLITNKEKKVMLIIPSFIIFLILFITIVSLVYSSKIFGNNIWDNWNATTQNVITTGILFGSLGASIRLLSLWLMYGNVKQLTSFRLYHNLLDIVLSAGISIVISWIASVGQKQFGFCHYAICFIAGILPNTVFQALVTFAISPLLRNKQPKIIGPFSLDAIRLSELKVKTYEDLLTYKESEAELQKISGIPKRRIKRLIQMAEKNINISSAASLSSVSDKKNSSDKN